MPSVLPCSSTPSQRVRFHSPAWRSRSACGMLRACASSSAIVCSAADSTFDCGAFTTMTPRRVAASTSTLSRPIPARPTTTRSVAGLEHLGGRPGSRCGSRARPRPAPRRAARSGESPSRTSTSSPARAHGLEPAVGELLGDEDALHRIEARRTVRRHSARHRPDRAPSSLAMRSTPSTRSSSPSANDSRAYPGAPNASPGHDRDLRLVEEQLARARASSCGVRPAISRPSTPSNDGKQ